MFTAIKNWLHRMFGKTEEKAVQPVKDKEKAVPRRQESRLKRPLPAPTARTKKEKSAQDSIPYERMWPDGICRVSDGHYTKTIQFQDINYQLSQNEDKTAIFEGWCDFLNYFDSSIQFAAVFFEPCSIGGNLCPRHQHPAFKGMILTVSGWSTPPCCKTSWQRATTALSKPSISPLALTRTASRRPSPVWSALRPTFSITSSGWVWRPETLDGKARLSQLHAVSSTWMSSSPFQF